MTINVGELVTVSGWTLSQQKTLDVKGDSIWIKAVGPAPHIRSRLFSDLVKDCLRRPKRTSWERAELVYARVADVILEIGVSRVAVSAVCAQKVSREAGSIGDEDKVLLLLV